MASACPQPQPAPSPEPCIPLLWLPLLLCAMPQFIDDVEFWFKAGPGARVEYRSASRLGFRDGNVNRKRIKALRQALERKGWASTGF